jgi:hypothetical protein
VFYEIRRYEIQPGRRDEWVAYMESVIIPFMVETGMSVTGSFVDEENPDVYLWIRRFDDEEHRKRAYAATYEHERWTGEIFPVVKELLILDRIQVTRIEPTRISALR